MHQLKPSPLFGLPPTKKCPICGQASYSRDGIHPQCSMLQADSTRVLRPKKKPPSKAGRFGAPKNAATVQKQTVQKQIVPKPIAAVRGRPRKSA